MSDFRPGGFQQLPMVVKNIIIINILVFGVQFLCEKQGIPINDYLALHYWQSSLFRPWQLITHMFMHGSFTHILFNMFAVWMFGNVLENIWGPKRFLIFYLVCGVGAAICHEAVLTYQYMPLHNAYVAYMHNPGVAAFADFINRYHIHGINSAYIDNWSANPGNTQYTVESIRALNDLFNEATLGASGAVFGLLFAFGYLFPNTMLYVYFAIPVKAKWFVAGYAVLELYSGIQNSAGDNIAHFAHLGGMLFAFILLRIWKDKIRNRFY